MNLQDRKATQSVPRALHVVRATKKLALILALGALLGGCVTNAQAFKAYVGEVNCAQFDAKRRRGEGREKEWGSRKC